MSILEFPRQSEIDFEAIKAELREKSSEELWKEFHHYNDQTIYAVVRMALVVSEMVERGEDTSHIVGKDSLLKIADGRILPEVAWKFIASSNRRKIESLPISAQRKLVENPAVPVIEPLENGKYTTRMMDVSDMPATVFDVAIGPEGPRPPEEQIACLAQKKQVDAIASKAKSDDNTPSEPLTRSVSIKLTESEDEALKIAAAKARISPAQMARRMLLKGGLGK